MTTYLLSHPSPSWRIIGKGNPLAQHKAPASPGKALAEWTKLADTLSALGAQLAVLPPPAHEPPMTGLVYTANAGHRFGDQFRLSQMTAAHRHEEANVVSSFVEKLGLYTERAEHPWEGQAEIIPCGEGRYLVTWGVRSAPESVDEVRSLLPKGSASFSLQLRPPFSHGDSCTAYLESPTGEPLFLLYPNALLEKNLSELEAFLGPRVEILPVSEHDAYSFACNMLQYKNNLLIPKGLSPKLLQTLTQRGFALSELEFSELFGKGGGGPRALVNHLGELSVPDALRYTKLPQ